MLSDTLRSGDTRKIIDELDKSCYDARRKYIETRWKPALRRLPGFLESDIDIQTDVNVEQPKRQIVATINFCYRNYLAFLAGAIPRLRNLQGIAASREVKDLRAAFSVERAVRSEMFGHRGAFSDEILRLISFVYTCHTGYVLVEGVVKKGDTYGEVRLQSYSPIDVTWYPGVRRMNDSPVVVVKERMTRETIEERWGAIPKGLDGARWPQNTGMEAIQPGTENSVYEVARVFVKPCKTYPKGLSRIVLTGSERELWKSREGKGKKAPETIGTPDGEYPVVSISDIPCGYLDFGESRMNLMQGPQKVANVAWSRHVQAVMENPLYTLFLPQGSGVDEDTYHNKTTLIAHYTPVPGGKPKLEATPTATTGLDLMAAAEGLINNISGKSPVSRGQSEGSRMPVGTTRTLVEKAADQDEPLIERLKQGISIIAERIIIEGRNVWKPNKIFLVVGAHRKYEAIEFKKADLADHFSVRVRPDDALPKNDGDRWEAIAKGLQAGLYGPPDDPKTGQRARKDLQISTEEEEYAWGHKDDQRAYDDFLTMREGKEPAVSLADDHRVHFHSEKRYAVEEMNATGKPLGPEMEERMNAHWEAHAIAQQRNNEIEAAMSQVPTPQPEGPPEGQPGAPPEEGGVPGELPPEAGMEQLPPEGGLPPEAGLQQL